MTTPLQIAARHLILRWDSPLWKDQPHTGVYIAELSKALAGEQAQAVEPATGERAELSAFAVECSLRPNSMGDKLLFKRIAEILEADGKVQQVAVPQPVARVDSWTNGSYSRNYKITWLENVPEGTLLYAAAQGAKP